MVDAWTLPTSRQTVCFHEDAGEVEVTQDSTAETPQRSVSSSTSCNSCPRPFFLTGKCPVSVEGSLISVKIRSPQRCHGICSKPWQSFVSIVCCSRRRNKHSRDYYMVPVLVQDDILKENMSREGQDWQRPQKGEEGVCCIQLGKLSAFSISQRKRKGAYVGFSKTLRLFCCRYEERWSQIWRRSRQVWWLERGPKAWMRSWWRQPQTLLLFNVGCLRHCEGGGALEQEIPIFICGFGQLPCQSHAVWTGLI